MSACGYPELFLNSCRPLRGLNFFWGTGPGVRRAHPGLYAVVRSADLFNPQVFRPSLVGIAQPLKGQTDLSLCHLKSELNRQLYLPWITHALTQKAIEIEETWRRQRILISRPRKRVNSIPVSKGIEHFDGGNQLVPLAESERP